MMMSENVGVHETGSITDIAATRVQAANDAVLSQDSAGFNSTMKNAHNNPFMMNLQNQAMWSSAKSKDSEHRLSFGGSNKLIANESVQSRHRGPSHSPERVTDHGITNFVDQKSGGMKH